MRQKQAFDWKVFFQAVLTIAFPVALQNLLSTTAGMVDTIMIGSQGELSVAAVGVCSQISSFFYSSFAGFAGGAVLFFAQNWGARNFKGINRTLGISMVILLCFGLGFGSVAVINPRLLLRLYTDKENIIALGLPYLRIVGFSYPLTVMVVLMSFLLRSTERVKAPLVCSLIGLVINFTLNWILIYGRFGFPAMGPAGAAVGTLCSTIVNFSLLLIFLLKDQKTVRLKLRDMFDWNHEFIGMYIKKCLPIACNEIFYGTGHMLINVVIGRQSESAIAAMAAFRVLEGFVYAFFGGMADASSVIVGKQIGSGQHMKGYQYMKAFAVVCPAVTFVICTVFFLFNQPLLGLFGLEAEAMNYGKYMLLIYIAAGTLRTCNYSMNNCYRAGGESVFGTLVEVLGLFLLSVPATWIGGMVLHLPFLAVFAFLYTDEIVRLVCELWYTSTGKWIKPVTAEGRATLDAFHRELKELKSRRKK